MTQKEWNRIQQWVKTERKSIDVGSITLYPASIRFITNPSDWLKNECAERYGSIYFHPEKNVKITETGVIAVGRHFDNQNGKPKLNVPFNHIKHIKIYGYN